MADSWGTPQWLLSMFDDYFDPCPLNEHWKVDGLQLEWKDKTYVNPPYSNPKPWVKKAIEESKKGKRIVMLLNCDPSTEWFSLLNQANAHFLWFAERLKFLENGKEKGANNKPNMLVILSDDYFCKKDEPNTHRDAGKLGDESHLHGLGVSPMSIEDEIKQELHKDYGGVQ